MPQSRQHLTLTDTCLPDRDDDSLQQYKESLGLTGGKDLSDPSDPRVFIIQSLSMESPGRPAVTIDLSTPESQHNLKDKPFNIKQRTKFTMSVTFKVQHKTLSGLSYVQIVTRNGLQVSKDREVMGTYGPNTENVPTYAMRFQEKEAPGGMLAIGRYNVLSSFIDDDEQKYLKFEWSFDIVKDWE